MKKKTKKKVKFTKEEKIHYRIYAYLDELGIDSPYERATELLERLKKI